MVKCRDCKGVRNGYGYYCGKKANINDVDPDQERVCGQFEGME